MFHFYYDESFDIAKFLKQSQKPHVPLDHTLRITALLYLWFWKPRNQWEIHLVMYFKPVPMRLKTSTKITIICNDQIFSTVWYMFLQFLIHYILHSVLFSVSINLNRLPVEGSSSHVLTFLGNLKLHLYVQVSHDSNYKIWTKFTCYLLMVMVLSRFPDCFYVFLLL